jgi:hypothetical protein
LLQLGSGLVKLGWALVLLASGLAQLGVKYARAEPS